MAMNVEEWNTNIKLLYMFKFIALEMNLLHVQFLHRYICDWQHEIHKKGWFSLESNQATGCSPYFVYFYRQGKE